MRESRSFLPPLGASLLAGLVLLTGCGKSGANLSPRAAAPLLSLRPSTAASVSTDAAARAGTASRHGIYMRIWPHEDGRSWTYRLTNRAWDYQLGPFYDSPGDAPTLTLDQAAALLRDYPIGPTPVTATGSYAIRFNGTITTASGVTKQRLEETITPGGDAASLTAARPGTAFLRLLRRARPDLARRLDMTGVAAAPALQADVLGGPTLLFGYAWEQNDDWIGAFGDLNQSVSWIYLTSDLTPGSEYTLQLVPDLADDVFLHGRVLDYGDVTTEAGTFHHALEVLYLVDFGVAQATDADGNPVGYYRSYLFGTVWYVPGVGPVRSYERTIFFTHDPLGLGSGDVATSLVRTDPGPDRAIAAR